MNGKGSFVRQFIPTSEKLSSTPMIRVNGKKHNSILKMNTITPNNNSSTKARSKNKFAFFFFIFFNFFFIIWREEYKGDENPSVDWDTNGRRSEPDPDNKRGETVEASPAYLENLAKGLSRCLSLAVSFPVEKPSSNHTPIIYLSHFSIDGPNKHPSQSSQQTLHWH